MERGDGTMVIRRSAGTLAVVAAVVLAGLSACRPVGGNVQDAAADTLRAAGVRVINVEVMPIVPDSFVEYIRVTGEIEALHDVTVSAEEAGVIARFFVRKGERVAREAPIAKIDDKLLAAQVAEARALAELAAEQYERQRRLWEEERIGSEIAYLQARSSAEAARARLAALEERLDRTVIRAPVGGIVDDDLVEVGEMVSPGTPVARIVAIHQVKVVAGVPERYASDLRRGEVARVRLDVFPEREFEGRLAYVGASVDARSRTVQVEILLENPELTVKPRMVANVQIPRARLKDVVVVPQDAVVRTEDGYEVFVVARNGQHPTAEARRVTLGPAYENRLVITDGLRPGDELITMGHRLVEHGSLVRVVRGGREGA